MKAFHLFCVVIILSLRTLFAVSPAQAKAPVTWEGDFSGTDTFNCGSFDVKNDWTSHAEGKDFYDSEGNWVLSLIYVTAHGHLYNPANGKEASTKAQFTWNETPGYQSVRGINYHIVAPGAGTILIDAGLVYSTDGFNSPPTLHGIHQTYEGDFSKLCAYFQ